MASERAHVYEHPGTGVRNLHWPGKMNCVEYGGPECEPLYDAAALDAARDAGYDKAVQDFAQAAKMERAAGAAAERERLRGLYHEKEMTTDTEDLEKAHYIGIPARLRRLAAALAEDSPR